MGGKVLNFVKDVPVIHTNCIVIANRVSEEKNRRRYVCTALKVVQKLQHSWQGLSSTFHDSSGSKLP